MARLDGYCCSVYWTHLCASIPHSLGSLRETAEGAGSETS